MRREANEPALQSGKFSRLSDTQSAACREITIQGGRILLMLGLSRRMEPMCSNTVTVSGAMFRNASDQIDCDIDVATCGLRVRADCMRTLHQILRDISRDAGQAHIQAGP